MEAGGLWETPDFCRKPGRCSTWLADYGRESLRACSRPIARSSTLYDHLAYLNYGGQIGVVRNVGHDLFRVRPETRLKRLDRITEDVTHADVGRRSAGCAAGKSLVDGVVDRRTLRRAERWAGRYVHPVARGAREGRRDGGTWPVLPIPAVVTSGEPTAIGKSCSG